MVKTSLQSFQFWKLNLILSTSIQYHSAIHSIPTQFRINLIPFYWVPPLPGTRLPDQSTSWPEPPSWRSSPWCTCPRRPTASRSPRTSCLRRVSNVWHCSDAVTICLQSRPVDPDVVCQLVSHSGMGYPGYPWISLRFQCFRIRRHIVTKSGDILWILSSVVLYMIQCADLRTGVQLAGYP